MNRTPVTSSNIVSIGHDPATRTLEVEFKGGAVYRYHHVPASEHAKLMAAPSIGKHMHQHIAFSFPFDLVAA